MSFYSKELRASFLFLSFVAETISWAHGGDGEFNLRKHLADFRKNPSAFMSDHRNVKKYVQTTVPIEVNPNTGEPTRWQVLGESEAPDGRGSKFERELRDHNQFVDRKNAYHEGLQITGEQMLRRGRAAINLANDNPESLVGPLNLTRLADMDGGYQSGTVSDAPWSSSYWPLYSGGIAQRYSDKNYPNSKNFSENYNYISQALGGDQNSCSVESLSPTEKFDLLIGDPNWTLTRFVLNNSKYYFDKYQVVESWMGICNGWAPASFRDKRPKHSIVVMAADKKTKIKFFPSDVKALSSHLWAKAPPPVKFIGQRCAIRNPRTDPENGRIIDEECFDTNPGTFHLTVVNQIGYKRKSFAFDATYDYEVWNQPAYSYEYTYFNPKTDQPVSKYKDALVKLDDPAFEDIFHKYRNDKRATHVVGINMKLTYVSETEPNTLEVDSPETDLHTSVNYQYDLELDKDGTIIGGEWHHKEHPDFMWAPVEDQVPLTIGDHYLNFMEDSAHWKTRELSPVPESWRQAALKSSSYGQPLGRIVRELIQKSRQLHFMGCNINWGDHRE